MHVTPDEFQKKLFDLEELANRIDIPATDVGQCGGQCRGLDEESHENLCPQCQRAFQREVGLITDANPEYDALLDELKAALNSDTTGRLKAILDQNDHMRHLIN